MLSHFKATVERFAQKRNIELFGSDVRDVERKLDRGEIGVSDAMSFLHGKFSYKLENGDYREIEKSLKSVAEELEREKRDAARQEKRVA